MVAVVAVLQEAKEEERIGSDMVFRNAATPSWSRNVAAEAIHQRKKW